MPTKKKVKKKTGRKPAPIEKDEVFKLATLMCTYDEIAAFFGVNKSTISRRFATEIEKGREVGKISLRRKQFKLADKNASMAIFLGKNYLGQRDNPEIEGTEDIGTYIEKLASALKESYTKAS